MAVTLAVSIAEGIDLSTHYTEHLKLVRHLSVNDTQMKKSKKPKPHKLYKNNI